MPSLLASEWFMVTLALLIGTGLLFLFEKLLTKPNKLLDDKFKSLRIWTPTVMRWGVAGLLIVNVYLGSLLTLNIGIMSSVVVSLFISILIAVTVLLLLGVYTQISGIVLLTLYLLSFFFTNSSMELINHIGYVGIGLFLVLSNSGKLSVDRKLVGPLTTFLRKFNYLALPILRIFIGLNLVILAFSEKLLNISVASDFLAIHSGWNFLSSFGLNDRNFIILTAIMEILIGLSYMLGKAVRFSTLILVIIVIVTTVFLGSAEIISYLFLAISVMFTIWVGPNNSPWSKNRVSNTHKNMQSYSSVTSVSSH